MSLKLKMDFEEKEEENSQDVQDTMQTLTFQNLLNRNIQLSKRLEQVTSDYQVIINQAQSVNVKYENTIKSLKMQLETERRANGELRKQLDFTDQIADLDKQLDSVDEILKTVFEKKRSLEIPPSAPETPVKPHLIPKKDAILLSAQEIEQNRINQELLKRRQRVNRISFHYAIKDPRFQSGHAQFSHSKEYHCKLRQANKEWKDKIYRLERETPGYIDQKYLQLAAENGWPLVDTAEDSVSSANTSDVDVMEEVSHINNQRSFLTLRSTLLSHQFWSF